MNEQNTVLDCANKLEGILCKYLNCGYNDFGVKANDNLTRGDWKSPVNFALGHRLASSNNDSLVKESIDYFLGNDFQGQSIGDIVERYEYYGFDSINDAYVYINETIDKLSEILFQ